MSRSFMARSPGVPTGNRLFSLIEGFSFGQTAARAGGLGAGRLHENPAQGLGGRCKEMSPAVPFSRILHIHEPQIRRVDRQTNIAAASRLQRLV